MLYKKQNQIYHSNVLVEIDEDEIKISGYTRKYTLNKLIVIDYWGIYITKESVIIDKINNFTINYHYPFILICNDIVIVNEISYVVPKIYLVSYYSNYAELHHDDSKSVINYKSNQLLRIKRTSSVIYEDNSGNSYVRYKSEDNLSLIKLQNSHFNLLDSLNSKLNNYIITKLTNKIHDLKGEDSGYII